MPKIEHLGPELAPGVPRKRKISFAGGCLEPVLANSAVRWLNARRIAFDTGDKVDGEPLWMRGLFADRSVDEVYVRCRRCAKCLGYQFHEWVEINMERFTRASFGAFVTLTFSPAWWRRMLRENFIGWGTVEESFGESPEDYSFDNPDLMRQTLDWLTIERQRAMDRIRKALLTKIRGSGNIRLEHFFAVPEIGGKGTRRIHLHMLVYFQGGSEKDFPMIRSLIKSNWGNARQGVGIADVKQLDGLRHVRYVCGYIAELKKTDGKVQAIKGRTLWTSQGFKMPYEQRTHLAPKMLPTGPLGSEVSRQVLRVDDNGASYVGSAIYANDTFSIRLDNASRAILNQMHEDRQHDKLSLSEQLALNLGRWSYEMIAGEPKKYQDHVEYTFDGPAVPQEQFWPSGRRMGSPTAMPEGEGEGLPSPDGVIEGGEDADKR